MHSSFILGTGHYVPDNIITNNDLIDLLNTSDKWIQERTGIKERRLCNDVQFTSDIAIKAVEAGIVDLDGDQRNFYWAKNKKKLMTVPFEENPYSAIAAWFKTDEGIEVFKSIEKRL